MARLYSVGLLLVVTLLGPSIPELPDRGEPIETRARSTELREAGYRNGYLPEDILTEVPSSEGRCALETEAAEAWEKLLVHAAHDGVFLQAGWCYRSKSGQERTFARNCPIIETPITETVESVNKNGKTILTEVVTGTSRRRSCRVPTATPGFSNHGWGRAVDVVDYRGRIISCRSSAFAWLKTNAHLYGWVHPWWAACGARLQEAWHWEWGGTRAVDPTVSLKIKMN